MRQQVLDGIRVVDLDAGPVGGRAATVLADFGAEVISIEPARRPALVRAARPFFQRGRPVTRADLDDPAIAASVADLVAEADVVIVAGRPSQLVKRKLDADHLTSASPRLIHCTISGFGPTGPDAELAGYEGIVAAKAGRMAAFDVQLNLGRPVFAALSVASHLASQGAVHGIVAALLQREVTGSGDRVETSLVQALMPLDLVDQLSYQLQARDGRSFTPLRQSSPMPTLNYHPLRTADGKWIQCGNLLEHLFVSFLDATDLLGELLSDERFSGPPGEWSPAATEVARDRILERMQERTAAEWMAIFDATANVAAEPILTSTQAIEHRDVAPSLIQITDPEVGATTQIGAIADLEATPASIGPRRLTDATPSWSERGDALLTDDLLFANAIASPVAVDGAAGAPGRPLDGITILDLSTIIAAPLAMSMLADLGARVIKIEPFGGDPFRGLLIEGRMAVKTSNGKESICIDLKSRAGQAIIHRMVTGADALVHNFRGQVPAKLGIDVGTLHSINPHLVWAVINGYAANSASALRPATHPVIGAATGGVAYQAGDALTRACPTLAEVREASRQIMAANEANPDPNTSVVAASSVLLALLAKRRYDIGQVVRINMQTANAWANGDDFLSYDDKPPRPPVDDEHLGLGACYRLYAAAQGWVFVAAPNDRAFASLCEVLGAAELASDPRFLDAPARATHHASLATELERRFAARGADEWESLMAGAGVACVRADGVEVGRYWTEDPHVLANGWAPMVEHARFGRVRRWGPLTTVGGVHDRYRSAPLAGEHTDALLDEFGYSPAEIATLRADRIVNTEER